MRHGCGVRKTLAILALPLVLAACGGEPKPAAKPPSAASTSPSPQSPKLPTSSAAAAKDIKAEVPSVVAIVELTEENDVNNLIGRPGQYDAATFLADRRLGCSSEDGWNDLGVDCGAKIERWGSADDAKARVADIQKKLKDFGLGAEYDYVRGNLLLRVAGDLRPSEVKQYADAFPESQPAM